MREPQLLVQRGTAGAVLIFRQQSDGSIEALNQIFGWSVLLDPSKHPTIDVETLLRGNFLEQERFQSALLLPGVLGPEYRHELCAAIRESKVYIVFFRAGATQQLEDVLNMLDSRTATSPAQG